jgi:hypothetical protein
MHKAVKILVSGFLIALAIGSVVVRSQETPPSEYQVKAAFLYNFVKFVEWPSEAFASETAPIVIGVLGDSPFGTDLEKMIKGKTINGRELAVRPVSMPELKLCQIVFICRSEKKRINEVFRALQGSSTLTVGELDRFTESGGMINFVMEGNKVRFEIKGDAAKQAGLKISSKLLSLALKKEGKP